MFQDFHRVFYEDRQTKLLLGDTPIPISSHRNAKCKEVCLWGRASGCIFFHEAWQQRRINKLKRSHRNSPRTHLHKTLMLGNLSLSVTASVWVLDQISGIEHINATCKNFPACEQDTSYAYVSVCLFLHMWNTKLVCLSEQVVISALSVPYGPWKVLEKHCFEMVSHRMRCLSLKKIHVWCILGTKF